VRGHAVTPLRPAAAAASASTHLSAPALFPDLTGRSTTSPSAWRRADREGRSEWGARRQRAASCSTASAKQQSAPDVEVAG